MSSQQIQYWHLQTYYLLNYLIIEKKNHPFKAIGVQTEPSRWMTSSKMKNEQVKWLTTQDNICGKTMPQWEEAILLSRKLQRMGAFYSWRQVSNSNKPSFFLTIVSPQLMMEVAEVDQSKETAFLCHLPNGCKPFCRLGQKSQTKWADNQRIDTMSYGFQDESN